MDEKETMTATFEPSLDVYRILKGKPTEYVVVNPVTVEARFKDGEVRRYPQEIRELITRCRDCEHAHPSPLADSEKLMCERFDEMFVSPDGFCAWGKPREGE